MYIDLTMEVSKRTPVFPGNPGMDLTPVNTLENEGWLTNRISINTHFATHIDAPCHMIKGAKKLDDYPIEYFIGSAMIVTVKDKIFIEPEDFEVPQNHPPFIFFRTDYSRKWLDSDYFDNNPVITEATANKIVQCGFRLVGIDSFTPDNAPYTVHKILFRNGILILENLMNLDKVPNGAKIIIAPLKLTDSEGAPVRVIAEF